MSGRGSGVDAGPEAPQDPPASAPAITHAAAAGEGVRCRAPLLLKTTVPRQYRATRWKSLGCVMDVAWVPFSLTSSLPSSSFMQTPSVALQSAIHTAAPSSSFTGLLQAVEGMRPECGEPCCVQWCGRSIVRLPCAACPGGMALPQRRLGLMVLQRVRGGALTGASTAPLLLNESHVHPYRADPAASVCLVLACKCHCVLQLLVDARPLTDACIMMRVMCDSHMQTLGSQTDFSTTAM